MTKLIFCANCQKETQHAIEVLSEVIATCECGRFLKFPVVKEAARFREMFNEHALANAGQVPATAPVVDTDVVAALENA